MTQSTLVAKASQLIDCQVEQAFEAFVSPEQIAQFWLQSTSAPLAKAATATDHASSRTRVSVEVSGFPSDDAVAQALSATEGFSIVLCDLKTLLESGRSAKLVKAKAELIAAETAAR